MMSYQPTNRHGRRLSVRGLAAVVFVVALLAAACGGGGSPAPGSQSTAAGSGTNQVDIDAAKKEGQLVIYTGAGQDSVVGWAKQFTDKYGIQVKVVRKASYPLWEQWQTELKARKNIADVLLMTDQTLYDTAIKAGQLMSFTPTSSANFNPIYTKQQYYYPLQLIALSIVYNTQVNSADDIKFIKDNGFNALVDARFGDGVEPVVTPAGGGSDYTWWYVLMHVESDKYGDDYVKKIAALNPKVYTSSLPVYSMVESGQYHLAGAASESTIALDWSKGAPIEWTFPDPTPVYTIPEAIAATAPHPNAAKLFQEWATSVEGQEAWYNGNWSMGAPMNSQAKDPRSFAKEAWYSPPKNPYTGWATDPNYAKLQPSLIRQWTSLMGG
jgi:iron(III) transport system substrate-binding protein